MWNAFGNGSGVYGGGGGYVSRAQGWEFVPRSRLEKERNRGRSCSPRRTISSPASVPHLFEEPKPVLGAVASESAVPAQASKYELQCQHSRLKKKFEELNKLHGQKKDEWMKEKEALLRQVAEIQGGENRRILLDLKSVLEEVQSELKQEATRRSDLQQLYTRDRCAWELERAELKCRIALLEAKEDKYHCEKTSPDPKETLKREREEQKRLLADTHTAAMDLRKQLESSERGWGRDKGELLERFDTERKQWESQLKDMQRKIEELYHEVKARRESNVNGQEHGTCDEVLRVYLRPPVSESICLNGTTDQKPHCVSEPDAPERDEILYKQEGMNISTPRGHDPAFVDHFNNESFQETTGFHNNNNSTMCGNDKKKHTSALNAALKEIAKVSEELCSYQDEIRQKSNLSNHSNRTHSVSVLEEYEEAQNEKNKAGPRCEPSHEIPAFNPQWSGDLRVTEEENNRINWACMNMDTNDSFVNSADRRARPLLMKKEAPPVPPRTTSWYLTSPVTPQAMDHSVAEVNKPWEPQDSFSGRKCNSPLVLRTFGALLQENEGKIFTDSGIFTNVVPADSQCNIDCCHSRWSCDMSKFGSKSPTYQPVQKRYSDVNMLSFEKDDSSDYKSTEKPKFPNGPFQSTDSKRESNSYCSSAEIRGPTSGTPSLYTETSRPKKNETLTMKTAEFNRTLLQTDMGDEVDEDSLILAKLCSNAKPSGSNPSCTLSYTEKDNEKEYFYPQRKASAFSEYIPNQTRNSTGLNAQGVSNGGLVWFGSSNANGKPVSNEHHLRPSQLASCPPPTDSRSNYRVAEKIFRGYENSSSSRLNSNCGMRQQQNPKPGFAQDNSDNLTEFLDMLQIEHEAQVSQRLSPAPCRQPNMHNDVRLEIQEQVHQSATNHLWPCNALPPVNNHPESSAPLARKKFSRPTRPANQRLPSRWARRLTPAPLAASRAPQKRIYAYSYYSETAIL
ncbi:protein SOGA3a isoform X1 [Acipenser ruthenus]|uniref:protein SOGA3a isoform X1 n=1 Tax=Acipenser ruthenus TaxID=7906 RepID=UPI00274136B1|nr:protein SOGA3a isoform X1 [Acipenser ruthenus]